jgi:hypothetical protein
MDEKGSPANVTNEQKTSFQFVFCRSGQFPVPFLRQTIKKASKTGQEIIRLFLLN